MPTQFWRGSRERVLEVLLASDFDEKKKMVKSHYTFFRHERERVKRRFLLVRNNFVIKALSEDMGLTGSSY